MITPFASSHCDLDHSFCDWQITTGTGLSRLSSGTGFTVEVEPGRRGVRLNLGHCHSSGQERHNVSQLDPVAQGPRPSWQRARPLKISTNKPRSKNCRSRTVPFSFEQTGILRLGPPFKERAALQRVPPRRGPFLPSS